MATRKKTMIVIHCTDTPRSMDVTVDMITQWHKARGFSTIGYAYFINRHGDIFKCRDLDGDGDVDDEVGAHAYGFNRESIGVCLEGRGQYTDAQWGSLRHVLTELIGKHGIKLDRIKGHNELDPKKECPMFDVSQKMKELLF